MFNSPFLFQITSAAPFSKEVKQKLEKGIKVTGVHMTDDRQFLGDIALSAGAQKKLDEFLGDFSNLPIEGDVALKFSKRKNLVLKFGKTSQAVDVKQIVVRKGKSRAFEVKITMNLLNIKSMTAAHIYDHFKETDEVTIEQTQEELPLKDAVKDGLESATGQKVLEGGDAFRRSKKGDKLGHSRRIPKNPSAGRAK